MKNEKLLAKLLALVSVPSIFIETVTTADLLINRVSGYEPTEIGTHTKNLLFRKLFYETSNSIPVAYFIDAFASIQDFANGFAIGKILVSLNF